MSVLITGIEMPTFRDDYVAIVIYGNGTIRSVHGYLIDGATAVPVPPHGDLIDRNAILRGDGRYIISFGKEGIDVSKINNAPTIIPKSGGTEDE